ncbi:MAG TPA: YggS family pyridoxal phosphate-dependent enzyme [Pseudobacteroides sp.]|uniref:YggS family pyridoxal phosphate-dependent enzyme n=1 Tax=Pseudobacteroides sp. TaxID=1968840 RepID=UPI002F93623A
MTGEFDYIKRNIEEVSKRVAAAAHRSGRKLEDIQIIAVTKTVGIEKINCAIDQGLNVLGENRVQELCEKYDILNRDCRWDLIGHLQTNKVKYIIDKVNLIHSVDRMELVQEIQKKAEKAGRVIDVLVQVNVAGEQSKFGLSHHEVKDFIKKINPFDAVKVKGLMTIAPYLQDIEAVRPVFKELYKIFIDIREENIDNIDMKLLSMGMSNDFEAAIEEGANIVRIGTAIFGKR